MTARIASSRWPLLTAIFLALALAAVLIPTTVGAGQESTALITVFESGGISERTARERNMGIQTAVIHGWSHATYYPGAKRLTIKLVYSDGSGRLLGGP